MVINPRATRDLRRLQPRATVGCVLRRPPPSVASRTVRTAASPGPRARVAGTLDGMRPTIPAVVIVAVALLSGCKRKSTAAREHFGKTYACPEDRVTVQPSNEKWGDAVLAKSNEPPPADVAKDPERLAKWKKDQEADRKESLDRLNALDTFDVSGCGHKALLACWGTGNQDGSPDGGATCQHRER